MDVQKIWMLLQIVKDLDPSLGAIRDECWRQLREANQSLTPHSEPVEEKKDGQSY